eukprot:CAMPEP_0194251488 /NCGR_PEP_ID=MMETSP0158-20130606/25489_1 /TAXON_ID=33649 /ORGANISM="Thalassionema nitzschioides, Strain L26-B" /LENGTH=655 /DNA_ID=CAMNT_0038988635 /DNA_START=188 /DNA_END=2151 /DNA_ORIENTATION=-
MAETPKKTLRNSESSLDHVVVSTPSIEVDELLAELTDDSYPAATAIRPSSLVRDWFNDLKRRASEIIQAPPSNTSVDQDDEFLLVPASGSESPKSDQLTDSDQLDVSMMVNINSDPVVEIMLENRIVKLETDLKACELEYEQHIDKLGKELQQQALNYENEKNRYEKKIEHLDDQISVLQNDISRNKDYVPSCRKDKIRIGELEEKILSLESQKSLETCEKDKRIKELEAKIMSLELDDGQVTKYPNNDIQSSSAQGYTCPLLKKERTCCLKNDEKLSVEQIERYARQLLLQDGFGVGGQCKLLSSSVLVVGAGGIGSTALLYLAASGVGNISVMDFDEVDRSNLHRQIIHRDESVGRNKAVSACQTIKALNPSIECTPIEGEITFENACEIISRHDCVVDASDNPRTRYLINDACVLSKRTLISGSAMGTEGQLTVYNYNDGPCYRCLYPKPNANEGCKTCSDNGVLGPVPGLIGILQAIEVLKVITGNGTVMNDRLLMYDSLKCDFVNIKKPRKSTKCPVCSESSFIKSMADSKVATVALRGPTGLEVVAKQTPSISKDLEISCVDYNALRNRGDDHILLDVRVKQQFDLCNLENSVNIPLEKLDNRLQQIEELSKGTKTVYCICRRGIASVAATQKISKAILDGKIKILSVR